jgi:hypothetical protein
MPSRRSRAARRSSLEHLLGPRNRRYRVGPSRTDRPLRPRTLSRIERERDGLSAYPRPRPLVERTDCSSIPGPMSIFFRFLQRCRERVKMDKIEDRWTLCGHWTGVVGQSRRDGNRSVTSRNWICEPSCCGPEGQADQRGARRRRDAAFSPEQ